MRKILFGAVIVLLVVFAIRYFENRWSQQEQLEANTELIQEQIKNVGKLIVTEGTFSQVYSYKDSKKFYLDVFSARKKALIVVNARVSIAYDLSELEIDVDKVNRTISITHIPEEEISINPDINYYDVTQDYLNQFEAEDYNKIKTQIEKSIRKKVEASNLKSNAQNRLISELQKIYILSNSMGWTLEYKGQKFEGQEELEAIKL
ncbi:DUF4230 domain-containing protein [Salegentibacter chungangensis]|uniref:DUF4230 domain-containing protein n=1 Tax=Salegentibacter chungangensis TaxID=1335724 RepID=A0ABW3NRH1_9FLAO